MHTSLTTRLSPTLLACIGASIHAAEADPIVITGQDEPTPPTELSDEALQNELALIPGGVSLIDAKDFEERQVSTIGEALRYVPGVWTSQTSRIDSISIRGSNLDHRTFDQNGVKVLVDGLSLTAADGNTQSQLIDPNSARRIEVYRGANAVQYGASTLGGAINFTSPTAYNTPSSVQVRAGSYDYLNIRATAAHRFNEKFDALVTVDSEQDGGYRDHNDQENLRIYANAGWNINDAISTRLYFTNLDLDMELPGSLSAEQVEEDRRQANPNAIKGDYQRNIDAYRIANKTTITLGDNERIDFGVVYEDQELFHPIVVASPPSLAACTFNVTEKITMAPLATTIRYPTITSRWVSMLALPILKAPIPITMVAFLAT